MGQHRWSDLAHPLVPDWISCRASKRWSFLDDFSFFSMDCAVSAVLSAVASLAVSLRSLTVFL
jgi:hypothetical protein